MTTGRINQISPHIHGRITVQDDARRRPSGSRQPADESGETAGAEVPPAVLGRARLSPCIDRRRLAREPPLPGACRTPFAGRGSGTARTAAASSLGSGQRHIGPLFFPSTAADRRVVSGRRRSPPQPMPCAADAARPPSLPPPATRRPSRKLVSTGGALDGRGSRISFRTGRR